MKSISRSQMKHPTRRPRPRQRFTRCCALWGLVWRGLRRLIPWMWRIGRHGAEQTSRWLLNQLLAPCLCFACIYAGVLLTLLLPTSLWSAMVSPDIARAVVSALTSFRLPDIPDADHLRKALLAALPLAVHVFRHGYLEWKTSIDPLGARILYACAVGVTWPKIWFRFKRRHAEQPAG